MHELVGRTVVLTDGTQVGVITEVESNPASDLLVLDSGGLVPVAFVVEHRRRRRHHHRPPDGLFDL